MVDRIVGQEKQFGEQTLRLQALARESQLQFGRGAARVNDHESRIFGVFEAVPERVLNAVTGFVNTKLQEGADVAIIDMSSGRTEIQMFNQDYYVKAMAPRANPAMPFEKSKEGNFSVRLKKNKDEAESLEIDVRSHHGVALVSRAEWNSTKNQRERIALLIHHHSKWYGVLDFNDNENEKGQWRINTVVARSIDFKPA